MYKNNRIWKLATQLLASDTIFEVQGKGGLFNSLNEIKYYKNSKLNYRPKGNSKNNLNNLKCPHNSKSGWALSY